jgi:hypothetical protein
LDVFAILESVSPPFDDAELGAEGFTCGIRQPINAEEISAGHQWVFEGRRGGRARTQYRSPAGEEQPNVSSKLKISNSKRFFDKPFF